MNTQRAMSALQDFFERFPIPYTSPAVAAAEMFGILNQAPVANNAGQINELESRVEELEQETESLRDERDDLLSIIDDYVAVHELYEERWADLRAEHKGLLRERIEIGMRAGQLLEENKDLKYQVQVRDEELAVLENERDIATYQRDKAEGLFGSFTD